MLKGRLHISRKARFLRALRKLHAWLGLSGAAFGLLFGFTGILMNHRAVMKLDVGRTEERKVQVELPGPAPTPEALAETLRQRLGWDPARVRARVQAGRPARFQGRDVQASEVWTVTYGGHAHAAKATYLPGNRTAELELRDANLVDALKRLHMASSGSAGWILLSDAFAGALLFLTLSGLLLWTRLAGSRLLALGLALGGLAALVGVASAAW